MFWINLILIAIFFGCSFTVVYSLIYSIAGHFYQRKTFQNQDQYKKIAVLLPAFKGQDEDILRNAKHALFQKFPSHRYDVIVVADYLNPETIDGLKKLPLILIETKTNETSKVKLLNAIFNQIKSGYDIAVVLDACKMMRPDFLDKINAAFVSGCYAVQGHCITKYKNAAYSTLDILNAEVNNHIMRKGPAAIGFSSAMLGSGMAFSFLYLKQVVIEMNADNATDKELELTLIEDNHKIVYIDDAIVLEETESHPRRLESIHWITNQFIYLRKYWVKGLFNLLSGKLDYANKVSHYALVPKIILVAFLISMTIISWFFPETIVTGFKSWLTLMSMYFLAILSAIPLKFWKQLTGNKSITFAGMALTEE